MIQPTLTNLHPYGYTQGLRYYPFAPNLGTCVESCIILNDLSNKTCVANEKKYLNLSISNMITGINESKIWTKHISSECKCKLDGRKFNSNQKWNNDKCRCEWRNPKEQHMCEKHYIWNPATCSCENHKYLATIIGDSVIRCDKILETKKTFPKNRNKKSSL